MMETIRETMLRGFESMERFGKLPEAMQVAHAANKKLEGTDGWEPIPVANSTLKDVGSATGFK